MLSSRNTIVSRISSVMCPSNVKCRHKTCCRLNRQLTLRRSIVKWLYLIGSAFLLIVYIEWDNQFHLHTNRPTHDTPEVDRATCCQHPNGTEDICSRSNCTLPACTKPEMEIDSISRKSPLNSQAFFIESSGNGALNYRQACAVESLALHNPNLTVNVLFTDADVNARLVTVQKLVEKYTNIQLISINVGEFMAGTLMEHWYHCTNWRNGSYHVNNLSNALRLLTVYKFGGYYFDLDIISVRPVTSYRNFLAAESDKDVNNGVIHADAKHPFTELAITDFVANFRPDVWGNNGPALMFRVLKKWCNANNLESMDHVSCRGFNILPARSFHPVDFDSRKELFAQPMVTETEVNKPINWLTEEVVGVHVWNRMSQNELVYKNSSQVYTRLARQHCPVIFSIAPQIF